MSTRFTATIEHVTHTTSKAVVRSHSFLVDRSRARDGFDLGPAGGEYLLVSLGGCFTSHLLAAIRGRNAPVSCVRVDVTGTMSGSPERFTAFTVNVSARCDEVDLVRKLVVVAARACQVVNTISPVASIAFSLEGSPIEVTLSAAELPA